jgi:hypothetical protein
MKLQRQDIVGCRIAGIWESLAGDGPYVDHFVSLDNGLLVKFSWGELTAVESPGPPLSRAEPWLAMGAPKEGDDPKATACIGQRIVEVAYSRAEVAATGEMRRDRTYFLLEDGRYLTSGLGFNYTELEADSFQRWYRQNKFADMFRIHWSDEPFNPFGPQALEGEWGGWTVIAPGSGEGSAEPGAAADGGA